MSNLIGILEYTKIMIDRYRNETGIAVDMTLGKGNDSFYLAKKFKKVYSFDIQQEAIEISKNKLKEFDNIEIIKDSHENFDNYVKEKVNLFIYNLGYLPGYSQEIVTKKESTINSLNKALLHLTHKGIVIIVVYVGHEEGNKEGIALNEYIDKIDREYFIISKYQTMANKAPYVICISKK